MTDDILKEYEVVPDKARLTTEYIEKIYKKLFGEKGYQDDDIESDSAIAFIEILLRVWRDGFPDEYEGRLMQQREYWETERSIQQAVKSDGGYFTASFPPRIWALFKIYLPNVKWTDRKNTIKLTDNFPILKGSQYKI